jgi:DNA-directed RNA polymerase specialized sigma24 family protein
MSHPPPKERHVVTEPRPPRCRPVPPAVAERVRAPEADASEAALLSRLEDALAALPEAERQAVVAAHGYDEGAVGAAVETGHDPADAEALARNGLQLLRAALEREQR